MIARSQKALRLEVLSLFITQVASFSFGSIDNIGNDTVTVLGREWRIFNGDGSLHREIRRGTSESRMVVGLQPILEPGDSFIYYSGTDVKSSSGFMEGSFEVRTRDQTAMLL